MPHSLFLGSALATQDRISPNPPKALPPSITLAEGYLTQQQAEIISYPRRLFQMAHHFIASMFRVTRETEGTVEPKCHADRENNPLAFVQAHLYHGIVDMAISLLGVAVLINSLCVICASGL